MYQKKKEGTLRIVPAILTNDKQDLELKIHQASKFAALSQIDVMDGIFVPSHSVGYSELGPIQTNMELEIHLMVIKPQDYFEGYKNAGAKRIIFHFEATDKPAQLLKQLKEMELEAGIAINPETPVISILPFLNDLDMLLLLAVNPGFYGSPFIPSVLDKARELSSIFASNAKPPVLALDGGVKPDNILDIYRSGVTQAVVGSAMFKGDPEENYNNFLEKISLNMIV